VVSRLQAEGTGGRLAFARAVEQRILAALERHKPGRALQTNVEYYTALVHEALGLTRDLFTPVFAIGRVAGWVAHVHEQWRDGRLLRPQSRYVGPRPVTA
jgi:citrate synthase